MKKKTMKVILSVLLVAALICAMAVPAFAGNGSDDRTLKIATLSDTHYLSPTMIKDTADYTTDLNSDRKLLTESDAILDKMLDTVREDKPDVLMISGDLTKDGELENHKAVAAKLRKLKEDMPGLKIYVINGNHDIRNSDGKNFNTSDGKAVAATVTQPQDFIDTYDFVYDDDSIIARYTPPAGTEAGSCSYVARPKDGYTIIAIDSCRYSSDNTSNGKKEHETSGKISASLEKWVLEQIREAKQRGDVVIGLEHHGMVEHFTKESEYMSMYLVKDYERISAEFADAGMSYIFTGHMHASDIAMKTTDNGNTIYDIETGSAITYPSPMREITFTRTDISSSGTASLSADIKTKTHAGPITYTDPLSGQTKTIEDLTEYGRKGGLTPEMLSTLADRYGTSYIKKYLGTNVITNAICADADNIVRDICAIKTDDTHTMLDAVNYIYQSHLAGEDNGAYPYWVNQALSQLNSGMIIQKIKDVIRADILKNANNIFTRSLIRKMYDRVMNATFDKFIDSLAYGFLDSMGHDTNYADDNNTVLYATVKYDAAEAAADTTKDSEVQYTIDPALIAGSGYLGDAA